MKLFITVMFMFIAAPVFAVDVDLEALGPILRPVLEVLFSFLPGSVIGVISLIGGFRVLFKPLMALLEAISVYTPSKKDDAMFKELSEGNVYKTLRFVLDFIASIKLPVKK